MALISIICRWTILFSMGLSVVVHVHGFSQPEETALAKFHSKVDGTLPQDFMNSNAFLIRFLRLNDLNVGDAEAELKTYLEAREKEGLDKIKAEVVRGMEKVMPFRLEGVDKEGRPILEYFGGKTEIRRIALAGKSELIYKYLLFNYEKALRKTIEIAETTGKDIDSFYFIAEIEGFNTRDHLCVNCFPIIIGVIRLYSPIYGPFVKCTRVINAPRIFGPVAAAIKQIIRPKLLENFFIYDTNKDNWKNVLAGDIDADQLPPRLGGTNTQFDQKRVVKK